MVILLKLMEVGESIVQVDVLELQENAGWNPSLRSCIAMHCNIIWSGDQNQRQRAERQPSKCWHLGNIMSVRYFVFRIDNNFRALMRWLWTRIWRVNCQRQTLTRTALRDGQRYTADLCWRIPRTWSAKNYIHTFSALSEFTLSPHTSRQDSINLGKLCIQVLYLFINQRPPRTRPYWLFN